MNIINLTPHAITMVTPAGDVDVPPSGQICRVDYRNRPLVDCKWAWMQVGGLPVSVRYGMGPLTGLPPAVDGTTFIVSAQCLDSILTRGDTRPDVVAPLNFRRDDKGRITGCTAFIRAGSPDECSGWAAMMASDTADGAFGQND